MVGYHGSKIFCLNYSSISTIDAPQVRTISGVGLFIYYFIAILPFLLSSVSSNATVLGKENVLVGLGIMIIVVGVQFSMLLLFVITTMYLYISTYLLCTRSQA